jgi:hypothetical protein
MNNIENHIKELEERLLHTDVRENSIIVTELLSDDFEEVGSDGKISSREEVIEWLVNKEENVRWSLNDFRIKELSPDLIVATYIAVKDNQPNSSRSIRSSIWKKYSDNWKMIFHQGTKIISEKII